MQYLGDYEIISKLKHTIMLYQNIQFKFQDYPVFHFKETNAVFYHSQPKNIQIKYFWPEHHISIHILLE